MRSSAFVSKQMVLVIIIAIFGLFNPGPAMADTDDALLNTLPEDCIFCLRINNLNGSLGKLDQYLAGALPMPVNTAMLVNMQLISITGDPMMQGIDMAGDFAFFAIPPQADQSTPSAGLLVPVKSFNEFVNINPNCNSIDGGLALLSSENSPVGGILLAPVGDTYALAVPEMDKNNMGILQKSITNQSKMTKRLSAAQAKDAASAPVWAFFNLADLYQKYNQQALGFIQMAQMGASQDKNMADMMAFQFKMLTAMFQDFVGEADSMTLALRPEPTMLSLDTTFRAQDGTEFEQMLVSDGTSDGYDFTGYLDNSNAVNGLAKMNRTSLGKFYDKIFDIMVAASGDTALKEETEKMKVLAKQALEAMGDELSFSYSYTSGQPPFELQEVVAVKDSAAMKAMMAESMEYTNALYKGMGIPAALNYEPGALTYKNIPIDVVSISATGADDPNNAMQQGMNMMYGGQFKYYLAQTQDKFYITMGPGSEEKLKALMDQSTSAPAPEDIKIAMNALKGTGYNDFVCSINVIKLLQGMGEMMQTMSSQPGMAPAAAMFGGIKDVPTQSCLVLGGKVADGQAAMRLAIPKQHLIEIVAMGVQIQQQMMASQQATMQNQQPADMQISPVLDPQSAAPSRQNELVSWIGKPAPDLKMVDLQGTTNRVSRLKGKKVLLDFWATWCPPCKESIPVLTQLRTDAKPSELAIFGLSDEPVDRLNKFAKENKMNYPLIAYNNGDLPTPYNQINAIPTLILIDSKGIIRDILVGFHPMEELQSRLNKLD